MEQYGWKLIMIREDLDKRIKDAMKSQDKDLLYVLKMIKASYSAFETSKGYKESDFTDAKEVSLLQKMEKNWAEEVDTFKSAGRDTDELQKRLDILRGFLPEKPTAEEIRNMVLESGIEPEMKNMRQIMSFLQTKWSTITGGEVSQVIRNFNAVN